MAMWSGYIYIFAAIPAQDLKVAPDPTAAESAEDTIRVIIGSFLNVKARLKELQLCCTYYKYEQVKDHPQEIGPIMLRHKAETLAHANLKDWTCRPILS
jgi:hypothetical protein